VQLGQRVAASGIANVQKGHGFVLGVTGAGLAYIRVTIRTTTNTTAATMRNATTLLMNAPQG
jgi:hypothetical protein